MFSLSSHNLSKKSTLSNLYYLTPSDPLEQFEVTSVLKIGRCLLLNNLEVTWGLVLVMFGSALWLYTHNLTTFLSYVVNSLYSLVKAIVQENLYIRKQQYFTVSLYLFATLLLANLVGLIPFAFTITSSFAITFYLALTHFVGVNLIGATSHRWYVNNLLLPGGVPLAITPFLIVIEAVSYAARMLSLSIRLFANSSSGHALLKILVGFALTSGSSYSFLLNLLAIFPWSVVTSVSFLELLIAFLQAYVFVVLVSLYVQDSLSPH